MYLHVETSYVFTIILQTSRWKNIYKLFNVYSLTLYKLFNTPVLSNSDIYLISKKTYLTNQYSRIVEHKNIASSSMLAQTGTSHFIVLTSLQQPEESDGSRTFCSSNNKTRSSFTARFFRLPSTTSSSNRMTNVLWYPS